jgi:hypothetical protein
VHPVLEHAEVGPSLAVERDDLTVEQDRPAVQQGDEVGEFRIPGRDLVAPAALRPDPVARHRCDGPHAVPLELEGPPGTRGRVPDRRQHR